MILHDVFDLIDNGWKFKDCPIIGTTVEKLNHMDLVEVDEKIYSATTWISDREQDHIGVCKIDINIDPENICAEDVLICPYCGDVNEDWGDDEQEECGQCGGVFKFQRNITVKYDIQPVKPPTIIKAERGKI